MSIRSYVSQGEPHSSEGSQPRSVCGVGDCCLYEKRNEAWVSLKASDLDPPTSSRYTPSGMISYNFMDGLVSRCNHDLL